MASYFLCAFLMFLSAIFYLTKNNTFGAFLLTISWLFIFVESVFGLDRLLDVLWRTMSCFSK